MNPLTPHEVEQLVSLRIALEDALSRAKGASKYRRGAAIVALDATVERASSMVAVTRGVPVPSNGKLDDLVSRLVQDFGPAWRPTVLPDIKHLRRARNASQHEGLEPDSEQVPLWASAADTYVSGLVAAQFGMDIRRMVLSDAIRDADLREYLREAERSRGLGDYRSCVDKSKAAYQEALQRWSRLAGSHAHHLSPNSSEVLDRKGYDYLKKQLGSVQAVLKSAAFAPNAAEAEWFMAAIGERGDILDAEDADRVLTFAFEWIVEYERAAESWTPNRRLRAAVAQRKVRLEDRPARIRECMTVDLSNGRIRAVFRVVDVPDEDGYRLWARTLGELLPAGGQDLWWTVFDDGTVEMLKAIEGQGDFSADVVTLASALDKTHVAVRKKLEAANEQNRVVKEKRLDFAEKFKAFRGNLPAWVEDIEWSEDGFGETKEQLLVTIQDEVFGLRFGERTPDAFFDDRNSLRDIIIGHELIQQCYGTLEAKKLGLMPILSAENLTDVFRQADIAVSEQLRIEECLKVEREQAVVTAKASIAAKLAELT
ncbi:hypothetical protein ACX80E_15080 [Arthrobacter sp. TMN-49]